MPTLSSPASPGVDAHLLQEMQSQDQFSGSRTGRLTGQEGVFRWRVISLPVSVYVFT